MTGRIVVYRVDRGYGFIETGAGGAQVFLHCGQFRLAIRRGDFTGRWIQFDEVQTPRGPRAVHVRLLDDPEPPEAVEEAGQA